jgi:hypothetical protein
MSQAGGVAYDVGSRELLDVSSNAALGYAFLLSA